MRKLGNTRKAPSSESLFRANCSEVMNSDSSTTSSTCALFWGDIRPKFPTTTVSSGSGSLSVDLTSILRFLLSTVSKTSSILVGFWLVLDPCFVGLTNLGIFMRCVDWAFLRFKWTTCSMGLDSVSDSISDSDSSSSGEIIRLITVTLSSTIMFRIRITNCKIQL